MRILIYSPFSLYLAASLAACSPTSPTSDLDLCKATFSKYPALRDDPGMPSEFGDLFTKDGQFSIGDTITQGRDAIVERHKTSHVTSVWSHQLGASTFRVEDGTIYANGDVVVLTGPDKDNLNTRIEANYSDEFEIVNNKCRIKIRKTKVTKTSPVHN